MLNFGYELFCSTCFKAFFRRKKVVRKAGDKVERLVCELLPLTTIALLDKLPLVTRGTLAIRVRGRERVARLKFATLDRVV